MKRILLVVFSLLFIGSSTLFAQKQFTKLMEKDQVTFSYRWKASKICKKDSPLVLLIKIENKNNYAVNATFTVDYFWEAIRSASSEELQFCLKGEKAMVGKVKKTGFDNSAYTNEQIMSEKFKMELNDLDIKEVDTCKK